MHKDMQQYCDFFKTEETTYLEKQTTLKQYELIYKDGDVDMVDLNSGEIYKFPDISSFNEENKWVGQWPMSKLCSMTGVPFAFVNKNPNELNKIIFDEWLPNAKKSEVTLKHRDIGSSVFQVRSILAKDHLDINVSEMLECLGIQWGKNITFHKVIGVERDFPYIFIQVTFTDKNIKTNDGMIWELGAVFMASVLGGLPITYEFIAMPLGEPEQFITFSPLTLSDQPGEPLIHFEYSSKKSNIKDWEMIFGEMWNIAPKKCLEQIGIVIDDSFVDVWNKDSMRHKFNEFKLISGVPRKFWEEVQGQLTGLSHTRHDFLMACLSTLPVIESDATPAAVWKNMLIRRTVGKVIGFIF